VAADDDGRPSFAEVVKAVSPPGLNWDEWKAAMREAHQTGGHYPGKVAPDISLPADGSLSSAIRNPGQRHARTLPCPGCHAYHEAGEPCQFGDRCCACGSPAVAYRDCQNKPFCAACADGRHPGQQPADPFTEADPPSIALAEMYWGMVRAGIPVTSVEGILGRMLAEHGRDDPEPPGE